MYRETKRKEWPNVAREKGRDRKDLIEEVAESIF